MPARTKQLFFMHVQGDAERDVEAWMRRKFEGRIREVEVVYREDLDLVGTQQHTLSSSCMISPIFNCCCTSRLQVHASNTQ